jgi:hypothetical protein
VVQFVGCRDEILGFNFFYMHFSVVSLQCTAMQGQVSCCESYILLFFCVAIRVQ